MPDDYSSNVDTTGAVAVGGSATGEIETGGDRDWFAVTLQAGSTYRIDLEGSPTGDGTLRDTFPRGIYDEDGGFLSGTTDDDDGVGYNSQVFFTATEDTTYYVAAGAYRSRTGTYTLSVTEVMDDFEAGTGTSGAVVVGGSSTGEIESPGDRDWFAVTLQAGSTYRIDLEGSPTGDGTLSDTFLRGIHDKDGGLFPGTTNDDGVGRNSRVFFTATEDATYYVAAGAYRSRKGTYTLSVTEVMDDFEAGTGTSGVVVVGGSSTGEIESPGDRDWFAVTLQAGSTYRIDLEGSPTGDGTLSDPYLRGIHDVNGDLISGTTNDNGGNRLNSRVFFTATEDATYYVAAGANGGRRGTYTLSVTDVTDDFEAGTGTGGAVEVGGSSTGEIEIPHDRDWFAVTLEADKTYRIDLKGSRTGSGTLSDPYLRGVHDANGDLIAGTGNNDSGAGRNSRVFFTATEDATYYVAAGAFAEGTGAYTLTVTEVTDDFEAGTGTSGAVVVDGSATGQIDYNNDRDWFAVELVAGKTYRIDLEGSPTGSGTLSDPYLRGIHDADGNLLRGTANDDSGEGRNSQVEFTATEDATYYVAAGAYRSRTGTYTLSVTEVTDDFAATTGTSGAVEVGGSATGEIEYPGDRDWFAVTLQAGRIYRIDLKGSSTESGTLADPHLWGVYDVNVDFISGTLNNGGGVGRNSAVYFTATEDGAYHVAAGAYGERTGTYTLSVTEVADEFEAGTGTSGAVEVGGSATGEIEFAGDQDWFAVDFDAGTTYRIDLKGDDTESGTLADPYLRGIHDKNGDRVTGTSDNHGGEGFDSRVFYTAAEAGTHYIAAGAFHTHKGTYTLSVEEVVDGM